MVRGLVFAAFAAFLAACACAKDTSSISIAGIVAASGDGFDDNSSDFDVLLFAVKAANLTAALDKTPNLTVFAPNDKAFITRAKELGYKGDSEGGAASFIATLLASIKDVSLKDVLFAHVVPEKLSSAMVLRKFSFDTLYGKATFNRTMTSPLELIDAATTLTNAKLIPEMLDIKAKNGIIHVIDNVIIPFKVGSPATTAPPKTKPMTKPMTTVTTDKCYKTYERCAGARGYPYHPYYNGCCSMSDTCTEAPWLGYGRHCLPRPPKEYAVGERCAGAPGKPYVPYAPCEDGAKCVEDPKRGWGLWCVPDKHTTTPPVMTKPATMPPKMTKPSTTPPMMTKPATAPPMKTKPGYKTMPPMSTVKYETMIKTMPSKKKNCKKRYHKY